MPAVERLFPMWVVYAHPKDFPKHFVVRVHWVTRPPTTDVEDVACLYDTLEEAMFDCEAKGLTWLGRHHEDEPQIVGVWV